MHPACCEGQDDVVLSRASGGHAACDGGRIAMSKTLATRAKTPKSRQVRILRRQLSDLRPSPENDRLYRPVDRNDPAIRDLADSIRKNKLKEPLVITLDNYIVS